MSPDGERPDSSNIFIRFRQHVDSAVASGFHSLLGFPPVPSSTPAPPDSPLDSPPPPSPPPRTMDLHGTRRPASCHLLSLASSASYSPAALGRLPQPVPNDLPPGHDFAVFTFHDAFEDLLAADQGLSLPDISTRYEQSKLLRRMFPTGEPAWFWVRRLESQGLILTPRWHRVPQIPAADWETFHRELDTRAAETWKTANGIDNGDQGSDDLFHQVARTFKQLERVFSPDVPQHGKPGSEEELRRPREPDTFDELFSSLSSAFADGQRSWDTFIKAITTPAATAADKHHPPNTTQDTRQVESRDEHVDSFGYLHSTVTRKTLDQDGNEIGRETVVTMRPAQYPVDSRSQPKTQNYDDLDPVNSVGDDSVNRRSSGWFWK